MKQIWKTAAVLLLLLLIWTSTALAMEGSTGSTTTFSVSTSKSDAYILLKASKGTAVYNHYNTFYPYSASSQYTETEDKYYGFFYVKVEGSGVYRTYQWVPSANTFVDRLGNKNWDTDTSLEVRFPYIGDYTVTVIPMVDSDINYTYWLQDKFIRWKSNATWKVTKEKNCSVKTGQSAHTSGTVTIRCYDSGTGKLITSYSETVTDSRYISPRYLSGYTEISSRQYVTYNAGSGTCSPSSIDFYYVFDRVMMADVDVYCCNLDGDVLQSETVTIDSSRYFYPPQISGYKATTSEVFVTLDPYTGKTTPAYVAFYYEKKGSSGSTKPSSPQQHTDPGTSTGGQYDIGVPSLNGRVYRENDQNLTVYWVQVQMKRTGQWYQGEKWDETGNLGDHTMSEIKDFMRSRGYRSHSGVVDQDVVNELASYLGSRMAPVYAGGFYDSMNTIMSGGATGSMTSIRSGSSSASVRWVQTILQWLGYYHGSIDGSYNSATQNAVRSFQNDHSFEKRDYVSLGVARAMLEAYYSSGGDMERLK